MAYLTNKVAVITNSGNQLGISIIEKLEVAGMAVIGLCKTSEELKHVREALKHLKSFKIHLIIANFDVHNVESIDAVFKNVVKYNGSIDVLISITSSDLECTLTKKTLQDFKEFIDTNVSAIVAYIRMSAGFMVENENRGHIMIISDCLNLDQLDKNLFTVTKTTLSSVNEILRHEFTYLNANIKTTYIDVEPCESFNAAPLIKYKEMYSDLAEMVINILRTPENLHVHELRLAVRME